MVRLGLSIAQCSLDFSNLAVHAVQVLGAIVPVQQECWAVDRHRPCPRLGIDDGYAGLADGQEVDVATVHLQALQASSAQPTSQPSSSRQGAHKLGGINQ